MTSSRRRPVSSRPATPTATGEPAQRGDIGRGVARSAGNNFGRVVVEDQDRRLTRYARELTVDELVDDEIAEDGYADAGKAVDEDQEAAGIDERRRGGDVAGVVWSRLSQNPGNGAHEIVGDRVGGMLRAFNSIAVAGADEHASRTDCRTSGDIVRAIPDDKRSMQVELMICGRAPEQAWLRLPAVAALSIDPDARLRMMRTEVEAIDSGAARSDGLRQRSMRRLDELFIEEAAGNPRLIGRHDDHESPTVEQPDGIDAVREESDALEPIEITHFLNQRAVSIQKDTTLHVRTSCRGLPSVAGGRRRDTAPTTVSTVMPVMQR